MIIESAGLTDVGRKREGNEDSFFVNDELRCYVVADGMGGHLAGEVASRMVVETLHRYIQDYKSGNVTVEMLDETLSLDGNMVLEGIRIANREVYGRSVNSTTKRGMGSTVALMYCTSSTIVAANVGDSPIYIIRNGCVESLSQIHTVEAELEVLSSERKNAVGSRYHHMLTRAVGIQENVHPSVVEAPFYDGDIVVLCSDGLSNKVTAEEIGDIVLSNSASEACRVLVGLANGRGGEDNITVVVVKLGKRKGLFASFFGFFSRVIGR
jgi:PPM family protein phosphatase